MLPDRPVFSHNESSHESFFDIWVAIAETYLIYLEKPNVFTIPRCYSLTKKPDRSLFLRKILAVPSQILAIMPLSILHLVVIVSFVTKS